MRVCNVAHDALQWDEHTTTDAVSQMSTTVYQALMRIAWHSHVYATEKENSHPAIHDS